ncbi:hypothetical protein AB0B89_09185 [Sphaerisporangium sp. NPDC049002]|uniref:hypothetical protein n=1 Tax=unclassified Sphaerisporangium TaxID=2630420 RepID=UPI0033E2F4FE
MIQGGSSGGHAEIHHKHRDVTGGWLRPAVSGAMDGLVPNFALIARDAGGGAGTRVVALSSSLFLTMGAGALTSALGTLLGAGGL